MKGAWRRWLLMVAAATLAGCSPGSSPGLAPQVVEAAPAANPSAPSSILTAGWDPAGRQIRLEAIDAASGNLDAAWDPLGVDDSGRHLATYAFSADRSGVALVTGTTPFCTPVAGGSACWPGADRLHFVDVRSRSVETFRLTPPGHVPAIAFSPDGSFLALARETRQGVSLSLWRRGSGMAAEAELDFTPSMIEYATDGDKLILVGSTPGSDPGMTEPGPLVVAVLSGDPLSVQWEKVLDIVHGSWCLEGCGDSHEQNLFASWTPAIVRLPGQDRIAIAHADSDRLTVVDAGRRSVETMPITAPRSWLDRWMAWGAAPSEAKGGSEGAYRQAVPSPDGKRLFLVGRDYDAWRDAAGLIQMSDTPIGLNVIDAATGARLASLETNADHVSLSAAGDSLFLRMWVGPALRTEILPVPGLSPAVGVDEWDVQPALDLAGKSVLLATSPSAGFNRVALIDRGDFGIGSPWTVSAEMTLLVP